MRRFPMSIDLENKPVYLIGSGPQIRDKAEKLKPFAPKLIQKDSFTPEDAASQPAMVIVGDTPPAEAERICALCRQHKIPVNAVDIPELCSFYFPSLITCGDLTISVATGGASPETAACLRRRIEEVIPENTDQILEWIRQNRDLLRKQKLLKAAVAAAFEKNRPLTDRELALLAEENLP